MLARASLPHAHTTRRRAHGRLKYHRRDAPFLFTAARPAARGPGARHHCHCAWAVAASRRPPHPLGARRDRRRLPSMRAATRTSTSVCTRSASAPRCDAPYASSGSTTSSGKRPRPARSAGRPRGQTTGSFLGFNDTMRSRRRPYQGPHKILSQPVSARAVRCGAR